MAGRFFDHHQTEIKRRGEGGIKGGGERGDPRNGTDRRHRTLLWEDLIFAWNVTWIIYSYNGDGRRLNSVFLQKKGPGGKTFNVVQEFPGTAPRSVIRVRRIHSGSPSTVYLYYNDYFIYVQNMRTPKIIGTYTDLAPNIL